MCCMEATFDNSFGLRRKGLRAALAGREGKSLSAVLRFLIKYIGDYRFTRTLIDVANMLLGKQSGWADIGLVIKKYVPYTYSEHMVPV